MSLRSELGEDSCALVDLYEADLKRHEDAVNGHNRTVLTIRGFAITAVAALVAATYVSHQWAPAVGGVIAAIYFSLLDYYYSQLYVEVERRIDVLESLAQSYRNLMSASRRTRDEKILELQGDLRSYAPRSVIPKSPELWENWKKQLQRRKEQLQRRLQRSSATEVDPSKPHAEEPEETEPARSGGSGSFGQFWVLYLLLALISSISVITLGDKPQETIVLCRPTNQIAPLGTGVKAEDCSASTEVEAEKAEPAREPQPKANPGGRAARR